MRPTKISGHRLLAVPRAAAGAVGGPTSLALYAADVIVASGTRTGAVTITDSSAASPHAVALSGTGTNRSGSKS